MTSPSFKRREFFFGWQQGRCYLHGCRMSLTLINGQFRRRDASEDHVRPRPEHRPYNSALACRECNERRGRRPATACMIWFAHEAWAAFEAVSDGAQDRGRVFVPERMGCAPLFPRGPKPPGPIALAMQEARLRRLERELRGRS